jgi:hypothetical protein
MPLTATGPISLAAENLRTLISICPAWQTWVGATEGDAAAKAAIAKASIHILDVQTPDAGHREALEKDELEAARPWIIIDLSLAQDMSGRPGFSYKKHANHLLIPEGDLLMVIEADVPEAYVADEASAKLDFLNKLGGVMADMASLAGDDGRINLTEIATITEAIRSDNTQAGTQGDYYGIVVGCRWN